MPGRRQQGRLSRPFTFAAIGVIFVVFMAASAAPTPLYVVYQQEWGFSASVLTVVFAVYVFGLIGSLLLFGALSDFVGRRPVLAAAIALEAIALLLFVLAGNVGVLLVARVLQGIATGAAMTTLGATLVDLNPPHAPGRAGVVNGVAPVGGLAVGAIGCGALVQFAPAPTHLVFLLLLAGMIVSAVVVALMPETTARRAGGLGFAGAAARHPGSAAGGRLCAAADPDRQLGARRAVPLARTVGRGGPVRSDQPPDRRARRHSAVWHRRHHGVHAAVLAGGAAAGDQLVPAGHRDRC